MATLPKFFIMQAPGNPTGPYLCPVQYPLRLMFEGTRIFSPRVKFESEKSKTGDATLVHIRSCFNNKYWVAHETGTTAGEFRIAASADKPEEDGTNPACTLFRLSTATTETGLPGFQLQSIRWSSYVRVFDNGPLTLSQSSQTGLCTFSARDWEMLVRLPSQVTFKTEDGKYLAVADDGSYNCNRYESGLEITDSRVAYQLFPTSHGYYHVKSLHNGKFWKRCDPGRIRNDNGYPEEDPNCIFECVIISDAEDIISLRNLGNNQLCGWQSDWLTAHYAAASPETRLVIGEPVLRREISIVEYHLPQSRIIEGQVMLLEHQNLDNRSPSEDLEESFPFSASVETTTGWDNTVSIKGGVSAKFKVAVIPFITNMKVELKFDVAYEHEWGGIEKVEHKIETDTKVFVPPSTKMKATLLCTKASCKVPFSYTQTDLLPNGRTVSTIKHDGLFTGVNAYDFRITSAVVDELGEELKLSKHEPATIEA